MQRFITSQILDKCCTYLLLYTYISQTPHLECMHSRIERGVDRKCFLRYLYAIPIIFQMTHNPQNAVLIMINMSENHAQYSRNLTESEIAQSNIYRCCIRNIKKQGIIMYANVIRATTNKHAHTLSLTIVIFTNPRKPLLLIIEHPIIQHCGTNTHVGPFCC